MNERHIIGDTFSYAGEVRFGGQPADLTGWTATSQIKGGGISSPLACELQIEDGRTRLTLSASPEQQAHWRVCTALLDIRLESPSGDVRHSAPVRIELARPITGKQP